MAPQTPEAAPRGPLPALPERLARVAAQVRPDRPLWDVGCDHGYLGLHAYCSGLCPQVHLLDRSSEVLRRTGSRLRQRFPAGLPAGLRLGLCDAEKEALDLGDGSLVLAGLGPWTTLRILERQFDGPAGRPRVVLAPDLNEERLRLALARRGWRLLHEELYRHNHHVRQILVCGREGPVVHPFWNASEASRPQGLLEEYLAQRRAYHGRVRRPQGDAAALQEALSAL